GIIGSLQATETLKILLGIGEIPLGKLTIYDALRSSFRRIKLRRDPSCRLCGDSPDIDSISNAETVAPATCFNETMETITTRELRQLLARGFDGLLIDVRQPEEHAEASIPQ